MPPRPRRVPGLLLAGSTLALLVLCAPASAATQAAGLGEQVVLLHGLAQAPRAMRPLEERLAAEGYRVHNLGYASRSDAPTDLVAHLRDAVDACCAEVLPIHFVGHSLGGILVRALLAEHRPAELGRVVMLAPPNRGSELVDRFGDEPWFAPLLGPTAADLGTRPGSLPNRLPPPNYELGVIAGAHPMASGLGRWLLTGRNDGIVSVAATRLPGMADFRLVESGHVRIRTDPVVADETLHFLRHGRFASGERAALPPGEAAVSPGLAAVPQAAGSPGLAAVPQAAGSPGLAAVPRPADPDRPLEGARR